MFSRQFTGIFYWPQNFRSTPMTSPPKTKTDRISLLIAAYLKSKIPQKEFDDKLKIFKLLYMAQGFSLQRDDSPLLQTAFENWQHGQVAVDIWHAWKDLPEYSKEDLPIPVADFLDCLVDIYDEYSGQQLSDFVHKHNNYNYSPDSPYSIVSEDQVMQEFSKNDPEKGIFLDLMKKQLEEKQHDRVQRLIDELKSELPEDTIATKQKSQDD